MKKCIFLTVVLFLNLEDIINMKFFDFTSMKYFLHSTKTVYKTLFELIAGVSFCKL